ncbi:MAG: hypothetical protein AAB416_04300 [Patescibacteria group bacterium]
MRLFQKLGEWFSGERSEGRVEPKVEATPPPQPAREARPATPKKSGWEKPGPKREQWWISVVGTEKITQFPRTEDMVHPTSQEAFRGSILARMGLSEPGHLVSQKEFAKSVAMWAHEARDGEISMIEQLVHRVNAQLGTNGGQIQEQMMPVIEGTLSQIRHEKGQRPSFIFRARVLEFLKSGEIPDERALLRVAGRDEYHRSLATWLDQSDEERINKLERYLHHALEVTQKTSTEKEGFEISAIREVVADSQKLVAAHRERVGSAPEKRPQDLGAPRTTREPAFDTIESAPPAMEAIPAQPGEPTPEDPEKILARYRGRILSGIGVVPSGAEADDKTFEEQFGTWLAADSTTDADISRVEKFLHEVTVTAARGRISKELTDFLTHATAMLVSALQERIVRTSSVPVHTPERETPAAAIPLLEEGEFSSTEPSVFRAHLLERIGASDGQEAVGQKYFENRLNEWIEKIKGEKEGAVRIQAARDFLERTEPFLASETKMKKRAEKSRAIKSSLEILS